MKKILFLLPILIAMSCFVPQEVRADSQNVDSTASIAFTTGTSSRGDPPLPNPNVPQKPHPILPNTSVEKNEQTFFNIFASWIMLMLVMYIWFIKLENRENRENRENEKV